VTKLARSSHGLPQPRRAFWRRFLFIGLMGCCAVGFVQTAQPQQAPEPSPASKPAGSDRDSQPTPKNAVDAHDAQQESDPSPPYKTQGPVSSPGENAPPVEKRATSAEVDAPPPGSPQARYDYWVLLPAVVAILLAILIRQVVPALVVGIFVGGYMLVPCLPMGDEFAGVSGVVAGFRIATERYIFGSLTHPDNGPNRLKVVIFTLIIGFTVGVIARNGGTAGMVRLVAGKTNSPRRGAITAWLAGLIVFFDDYANCMIIGPTMQPVFDRLKLSRAKLAYIVDTTAAPVASLAIIGTWIGAEIGYIQQGIDVVAKGSAPEFMRDASGNVVSGMIAFLNSIPYRFYPILALWFVFLIVLTGRDFGPMKRSERKVLSRIEPDPSPQAPEKGGAKAVKPRWWLGLIPVLVLVSATIAILVLSGWHSEKTAALMKAVNASGVNEWAAKAWWEKAGDVISNGDSYLSIFQGAILSAIAAILLTIITRACKLKDAFDAGIDGLTRMVPAVVILVLAWALSTVLQDLKVGEVVAGYLKAMSFPAHWLPFATFTAAAIISFATGTSWGTMGILCPFVVEIAARLITADGIETAEARTLFFAAIGSVLSGSVFGDHCSPISDTTVLSSLASGCSHEEHVWTQMPYALVTAFAAMGLGDVLSSAYHYPWYLGLAAGAAALLVVLFLLGRKPVASFELADA